MEFLALLALGANMGTQFLETILGQAKAFKTTWSLVNYHSRIDENKVTLKRKLEALCSVEEDINNSLEVEEFRTGKRRKREVKNWLNNVQRKKSDVKDMLQQIGGSKYLVGPWWESRVMKKICEVNELFEQGNFESLLPDVHETTRKEFITTNLVGQNSNGLLERIWVCLMNDLVVRIGVHGVGGVGKTAIMMHIHNKLLLHATFDNVYWVTLSDAYSIHKLQDDIAKEVGLDPFDEEDTKKRAARLFNALSTRKKCVLILDGLSSYFDLDKVGIPTEVNGSNCKLIITARSLRLCRRMSCQESVEIKPLLNGEAETLFKEELGSTTLPQNVEDIAKLVVAECGGLPRHIIRIAECMRGLDDINEWRNMLYTLQEFRGLNEQLQKFLEQLSLY